MACLLCGSDRDRMPADVVRPRHPGVRQRRSARRCRGLTGALNLSERRRGPVLPPQHPGAAWGAPAPKHQDCPKSSSIKFGLSLCKHSY